MNFPIYLWSAKTIQEEVPIEDEKEKASVDEQDTESTEDPIEEEAEVSALNKAV